MILYVIKTQKQAITTLVGHTCISFQFNIFSEKTKMYFKKRQKVLMKNRDKAVFSLILKKKNTKKGGMFLQFLAQYFQCKRQLIFNRLFT